MQRRKKAPAPPAPAPPHATLSWASLTSYSKTFDRWKNLTAGALAKAIYDVVRGETENLNVKPLSQNSVWGKIVKTLNFPNAKLDRLWAHSAFEGNRHNIQGILEDICIENGETFQNTIPLTPGTRAKTKRYCFCLRVEPDEEDGNVNYPMAECHDCKTWFHFICLGLNPKRFEDVPFICPICKNVDIITYVPLMFREVSGQVIAAPSSQSAMNQPSPLVHETIDESEIQDLPRSQVPVNKSLFSVESSGRGKLQKRQLTHLASLSHDHHRFDSSSSKNDHEQSRTELLSHSKPILKTTTLPQKTSLNVSLSETQGVDDYNLESQSVQDVNRQPGTTSSIFAITGRAPKSFSFKRRQIVEPDADSRPQDDDETSANAHEIQPGGAARFSGNVGKQANFTVTIPEDNNSSSETSGLSLGNSYSPASALGQAQTRSKETKKSLFRKRTDQDTDTASGYRYPTDPPIAVPDNRFEESSDDDFVNRPQLGITHSDQVGSNFPGEPCEEFLATTSETDELLPVEGPIRNFKPFNITIKKEDYKPLLNLTYNPEAKTSRYKWRFPRDAQGRPLWTHIFYDAYLRDCKPEVLKGCTLKFHDHRISRGETSVFMTTTGICTRKGSVECKMKYNFYIHDEPSQRQDVVVNIVPNGFLHHDLTRIDKRRLAGVKRDEVKKILEKEIASVVRRKKYGDDSTDKFAIGKGNLTEVQTLSVLQVARHEAFASKDFHQDPIQDIIGRREFFRRQEHLSTQQTPGFIQELSLHPFNVSLYTDRQMRLLRKYLSYNNAGVLTLDSTGRIIAELPDPYDEKNAFYYALVIQLPEGKESPVVPVLEYITNCHTAANNSHILHIFFRRFAELTRNDEIGLGIKRIETDASKALISSILQALEIGRTEKYLRDSWYCLQKQEPIYLVYHICRNHATRFLFKKIAESFAKVDQPPILKWARLFLLSKSLDEFCRRVKDIVVICGKKWSVEGVYMALSNLESELDPNERSLYGSDFLDFVPKKGNLYSKSPFSYFAIMMCHKYKVPIAPEIYSNSGNDALEAGNIHNSYFNKNFINYLIRNVFVYGCMMDHSLMILNGYATTQDTNAACEAWNKILKVDELKTKLGLKVGRFIEFQEENIKGRLEQFEPGLQRLMRLRGPQVAQVPELNQDVEQEETMEGSTEQWSGKGIHKTRAPQVSNPLFRVSLIPFTEVFATPHGLIRTSDFINIDNPLQILYTLWRENHHFKTYIEKNVCGQNYVTVFKLIDSKQFEKAKIFAIEQILQIQISSVSEIVYVNSETIFVQQMANMFPLMQSYKCKKNCINCYPKEFLYINMYRVRKPESIPILLKRSHFEAKCSLCERKQVEVELKWGRCGIFPFVVYIVSTEDEVRVKEQSLPSSLAIIGIPFSLYAYTFASKKNCFSVFICGGKKYLYDSKNNASLSRHHEAPTDHLVRTIWYICKGSME